MSETAVKRQCHLLEYHKEIFTEALNKNTLIVMGKGLGLLKVLSMFVSLNCTSKSLTFVINADNVAEKILYELNSSKVVPKEDFPRILTNKTNGEERRNLYNDGGCFILTSRILILDILQKRVNPDCVTGFLVYNAHRVTELSIEAFILRIFRRKNKGGFVKGFTDRVSALSKGFGKTQIIMKCLGVETISLWPRFHKSVSEELERQAPEVIELAQPLSSTMETIQTAIVKVMEMCLRHLGRVAKIDVSECTVAKGLLESFDAFLMERLNPQWSSIDFKSKMLIGDLRLLRRLLHHLIDYDCVTFHRFLLAVRETASQGFNDGNFYKQPSPWLMTDAADVIFAAARARVYKVPRKRPASTSSKSERGGKRKCGDGSTVYSRAIAAAVERQEATETQSTSFSRIPVLEENPKWGLLKEVIDEILELDDQRIESLKGKKKTLPKFLEAPIVVIAQGRRSGSEIVRVLTEGPKPYLNAKVEHYMKRDARLKTLVSESPVQEEEDEIDKFKRGILGTKEARAISMKQKVGKPQTSSVQILMGDRISTPKNLNEPGVGTNQDTSHFCTEVDTKAKQKNVYQRTDFGMGAKEWWEREIKIGASADFKKIPSQHFMGNKCVRFLRRSIVTLIADDPENLIDLNTSCNEMQPVYIVVYEPVPEVIRALEVYANQHPHLCVRVYFMIYEGSIEEQKYLSSLKEERAAFLNLIDFKFHTVVSRGVDSTVPGNSSSARPPPIVLDFTTGAKKLGSTRNARRAPSKPNRVICDVREFRSALPSMLDLQNMEVVPVTLTVGDYILTPQIVIERKSLSDLIGSFGSGRLVCQVEAMSRHFQLPVLLIEFSEDREFRLLQSALPSDIRVGHLISRLVLLTLNFPRLRLLWMRSPYATAAFFKTLKSKHDEPDVSGVVGTVGVGDDPGAFVLGDEKIVAVTANAGIVSTDSRMAPRDMLYRIPGVTIDNARALRKIAPTLAAMACVAKDILIAAVGAINGEKIYDFFNNSCTVKDLLEDSSGDRKANVVN